MSIFMEFPNLHGIVLEYINSIKHFTFMVCFVCFVFTLLLSVTHRGWQTVLHHFGSHKTVLVIGRSVYRLHFWCMRWWFMKYCRRLPYQTTVISVSQSFLFCHHRIVNLYISNHSTCIQSEKCFEGSPEWWSIKRQSSYFCPHFIGFPVLVLESHDLPKFWLQPGF